MTTNRQHIARKGERIAAAHLARRGLRILGFNVTTHWGEIDIIATSPGKIHFVEVKIRQSTSYGSAKEQLTRKKFSRLQRAAYLIRQKRIPFLRGTTQFDFVAIDWTDMTHYNIEIVWNIGLQDFS